MTAAFYTRSYGSSIETKSNLRRQELHRQNQSSKFLKSSFSNRDNKRAVIQFRGERQPQHIQKWVFFSRQIYFQINSKRVITLLKRTKLSIFSIEINKPLPASIFSDSQFRYKSRSQPYLLTQIWYLITLKVERSIISIDNNVTDSIIKKVINI